MKTNIKHYPPLTHAEDLQQICKPLESLGINYFAHVHVDNNSQFSAAGLNPEFVRLYLDKSYYNYDIHLASQNHDERYILWDLLELDKQSQTLQEDLRSFDLFHIFTMVKAGEHGKEYFHFASSAKNDQANNNYLQQIGHLKKFILYFKDKINAHKVLSTSYQHKFSISEKDSRFFMGNDLLPMDQEFSNQQLVVDRIYTNDNGAYVTKREFECLHWLSLGKTIADIASVLSITPRTVNAHIANIKEKVGCHNQFQLGILYQKLKSCMTSS